MLRATTFEEQSALAGSDVAPEELERSFRSMVVRNFSLGLLLGIVVFVLIRLTQYAMALAVLQQQLAA